MKKKIHEILAKIRTLILSENFKAAHISTNKSFSRNYLVTFPMMIVFILNLMRRSLQSELNSLVKIIGGPPISKQVFSAARKKLLPSAFVELNKKLLEEFYCDNVFNRFLDYRLIAIDGSTLQLPDGADIKKNMEYAPIRRRAWLWLEFLMHTILSTE